MADDKLYVVGQPLESMEPVPGAPSYAAPPHPGRFNCAGRYIDPDQIRRIMADDNECADCAELGHICRPCRKARYDARQPRPRGLIARLLGRA